MLIVGSVIQAINDGFFQSIVGIVPETVGLLLARDLLNDLVNNICTEVIQRLLNHLRHTAFEGFLCEVMRILHLSFWEHDNIHLRVREELLRRFTEHHG